MKSTIEGRGLENRVVLAPKNRKFFERTALPYGNEVRYEPGKEDDAAQALAALFNSTNPKLDFRLRRVVTTTRGTLSVFLWTEEKPSKPVRRGTVAEE